MAQDPNQFAQTPEKGQIALTSMPGGGSSISCINGGATALTAAIPVKIVDDASPIPKVIPISTLATDILLGFVVYNPKDVSVKQYEACEVAGQGCVIYLEAGGAVAKGAEVALLNVAGQVTAAGTGAKVGKALDKATASGQLIRVMLRIPNA